jgi:hypothetical protein
MFLALWEFEVKPGCENRFESVYGPGGDWARLFRTDAAYQGTRLVCDTLRKNFYLTIDSWLSRSAYESFLQSHASEYQALDAVCEGLTLNERRIGTYKEIFP